MKKIILLFVLLLLPLVASAYDFEFNGIFYEITSSEVPSVKVTYKERTGAKSGDYYTGIIMIPESVPFNNTIFVVDEIGEWAFYGSTAETIIIPNTIKKLGTGCFEWSDIESITIPGSIETIPCQAFWGCYNLLEITIQEGVKCFDEDCFGGGLKVQNITVPSTVESINSSSFYSSVFPNLIFKGNAPEIISKAGYILRAERSKAYIKEGKKESFINRGWNFGSFIEYDDGIIDVHPKFEVSNIVYSPIVLVGDYEVQVTGYKTPLNSVIIPSNVSFDNVNYIVSSIDQYAFKDGQDIESLYISGNIKTIGNIAFSNCINLKSVTLEEGVAEIGSSAFNNTGISKMVFPSTLEKIGENAFSGCQNLNKVYSKIQNPFDAENAFSLLTAMTGILYVPVGTKSLYETRLGWKNFATIIETNDFDDKEMFNLTYFVDGNEYKSYEIEEGTNITPEPAPTKEGYTFSGWSEIPETMPAHDVTVTGTFSINKYKLTYTVNGEEYKSYELDYGASITPEAAPTKEGYTFSGWSEIPETMPANDVTVTGSFTINSYKLTYMIDNKVYKEIMYEYGATITPELQPEGDYATFEWTGLPQTMPAHDVVVYASYTSGIIEILMTTQRSVYIYSPNGKNLEKLQKGLNIVVLDDGTVKKVVVK